MRQSVSRGYKKGNAHVRRIGRRSISGHYYFITTSTRKRRPIFSNDLYAKVAIEAFTASALLKDSQLICWVLMPDHVHWLLRLGSASTLSALIGSMKSSSSRLVRQAGFDNEVWGQGFHDSRLRRHDSIAIINRYIINNPVKAGIVRHADEYPYSSRAWRAR